METKEQYNKFETWALVEIMGHQRYAGFVTEQVVAGTAFLRIDIPAIESADGQVIAPAFSTLFGAGSIYAIRPTTESIARAVASTLKQQPIQLWDLPEAMREKLRAIPEKPRTYDPDDDFESTYYEDHDD